jgi:hypothetical protein
MERDNTPSNIFNVLEYRHGSWERVAKIIREAYPDTWTCNYLEIGVTEGKKNRFTVNLVKIKPHLDTSIPDPDGCIPLVLVPGGSISGKELYDHCMTWLDSVDSKAFSVTKKVEFKPNIQYGPYTWSDTADILRFLHICTTFTHVILRQESVDRVCMTKVDNYSHIDKPTCINNSAGNTEVIFPITYIDTKKLQTQYDMAITSHISDTVDKPYHPIIWAEVYNVKRFQEAHLERGTNNPSDWWEYETFVQCHCGMILSTYDSRIDTPIGHIAQRSKNEDDAIEKAKTGLASLELSDLFDNGLPDKCPECGQMHNDYELTEQHFRVMVRDDEDYDERYTLDEVKTMLPDVKVKLEGNEYNAGTRGSLLDKATLVIDKLNNSRYQVDWNIIHRSVLTGEVIELG